MTATIRKMSEHDLIEVGNLCEQLGYPVAALTLTERFKKLSELNKHQMFVSTSENKIAGFIHFELIEDLLEEDMVEVRAICVDQAFKGEGHGKLLMKAAENWSKELGIRSLFLSCHIVRNEAQKFYESNDFRLDRTSHFYRKSLN